jgi:acid phosphatase type 7
MQMLMSRLFLTAMLVGLAGCAPLGQPPQPGAQQSGAQQNVLIGAGDIAQCGNDPAQQSRAAETAALIEQIGGQVFAAGDLAYPRGTTEEFQHCYQPTWGRFKARTLPVPGNHEYLTPNASAYYDYWGAQAGPSGKGYYAAQLGTWRVIALNSNIDAGPDSEQARWLRQELAQHSARCTLAFWHHPVFSSGEHGANAHMAALWKLLFDAGADLVISAHEHDYERFAPLDDRGQPDARRGMRQLIVGTGGAKLREFKRVHPHSEVRNNETFGVIKLDLNAAGYDWEFIPVAGQGFSDRGSGACHD